MGEAAAAANVRAGQRSRYEPVVFICFFISGFSSLLYQVLWTRLAFAHFGVIIPVLSLTVSTFMLGLGLGAIYGGRWLAPVSRYLRVSPLVLYALAELLVAVGAFAVPAIFAWGGHLLVDAGTMSSVSFLLLSGVFIVLALLPWCIAMGATVPLMMGFVRQLDLVKDDGFSLLYVANVLGAACGAALTALALIELLGLFGTDMVGAVGNISIALLAVVTAWLTGNQHMAEVRPTAANAVDDTSYWLRPVLFITGFSSLGLEVCWTRDFTLQLKTSIYAFAAILTVYLIATCVGSSCYKAAKREHTAWPFERLAMWLYPLSLLPLYLSPPYADAPLWLPLVSIMPLCGLLGYTTPSLIDRFGQGDPVITGRLYAVNIAGGVLGPLVAGYLLLPVLGIRWSMILLALPLAFAYWLALGPAGWRRLRLVVVALVMLVVTILAPPTYDDVRLYGPGAQVHRDYAASAVAYGSGPNKQLLVNGVRITILTNITKVMAHLPMALQGKPHAVLDICFGMGTTFRSLASWGVQTTAVDLSPAVLASFGYFQPDAAAIAANPRNHMVADDGRRFLLRTDQMFDVITIDPPPPVGASGSSLLYSTEFYSVLKRRLAPNGILAQWVPGADDKTVQSIVVGLVESFKYVKIFREPVGGVHFLASMQPITNITPAEFVQRMPPAAQADLVEWMPGVTPIQYASSILAMEIPLSSVLPAGVNAQPITDDRPYNEYFVLRAFESPLTWQLMF